MTTRYRHSVGMQDDLQATIATIIARAPEWVRQELLSKEPAIRARAEEALAAMVADALKGTRSS